MSPPPKGKRPKLKPRLLKVKKPDPKEVHIHVQGDYYENRIQDSVVTGGIHRDTKTDKRTAGESGKEMFFDPEADPPEPLPDGYSPVFVECIHDDIDPATLKCNDCGKTNEEIQLGLDILELLPHDIVTEANPYKLAMITEAVKNSVKILSNQPNEVITGEYTQTKTITSDGKKPVSTKFNILISPDLTFDTDQGNLTSRTRHYGPPLSAHPEIRSEPMEINEIRECPYPSCHDPPEIMSPFGSHSNDVNQYDKTSLKQHLQQVHYWDFNDVDEYFGKPIPNAWEKQRVQKLMNQKEELAKDILEIEKNEDLVKILHRDGGIRSAKMKFFWSESDLKNKGPWGENPIHEMKLMIEKIKMIEWPENHTPAKEIYLHPIRWNQLRNYIMQSGCSHELNPKGHTITIQDVKIRSL